MTDVSAIRVIPLCGKVDEWPVWSEKFLAKAKRYGFKDLLQGKLSFPKFDESFDEDSDKGKKVLKMQRLMKLFLQNSFFQLIQRVVKVKLHLIWLKDVSQRSILMVMRQLHRKDSKTSLSPYLLLPWLS
jgi:hypothetical protein